MSWALLIRHRGGSWEIWERLPDGRERLVSEHTSARAAISAYQGRPS